MYYIRIVKITAPVDSVPHLHGLSIPIVFACYVS